MIFSTKSLNGTRRGIINEPGNVAIYLTRCLRRDSLKEIGKEGNSPLIINTNAIPCGFTNCDFLKVAVVERRVSSLYNDNL